MKLQIERSKFTTQERAIEIDDIDNCFIISTKIVDGSKRITFFGLFKKNRNFYTVEFENNGHTFSIKMVEMDTQSNGRHYKVKSFLEKENTDHFHFVNREVFFTAYNEVLESLSFSREYNWGNCNCEQGYQSV